jgi:transcriptional regulator with XRE-family HTH domain
MDLHLTDPANVGGRIRYMRELKGMKQPELAAARGISQPSLSDIESGKTKSPNAINLLKIAAVLDANPWWLATGEGGSTSLQKADEQDLLAVFRSLDDGKRRAIFAAAKALKGDDSAP